MAYVRMILLASCQQTCMTYTIAVCTMKNSWWWTEELSETCRVSFQKQIWEISASSWFYYGKFITMHRHMNVKFVTSLIIKKKELVSRGNKKQWLEEEKRGAHGQEMGQKATQSRSRLHVWKKQVWILGQQPTIQSDRYFTTCHSPSDKRRRHVSISYLHNLPQSLRQTQKACLNQLSSEPSSLTIQIHPSILF